MKHDWLARLPRYFKVKDLKGNLAFLILFTSLLQQSSAGETIEIQMASLADALVIPSRKQCIPVASPSHPHRKRRLEFLRVKDSFLEAAPRFKAAPQYRALQLLLLAETESFSPLLCSTPNTGHSVFERSQRSETKNCLITS